MTSRTEMTLSRFLEAEERINKQLESQEIAMRNLLQEHRDMQKLQYEFMAEQTKLHAEQVGMMEVYKGFKATVHVLGVIEKASVTITKISAALVVMWATWKFVIVETLKQVRGP